MMDYNSLRAAHRYARPDKEGKNWNLDGMTIDKQYYIITLSGCLYYLPASAYAEKHRFARLTLFTDRYEETKNGRKQKVIDTFIAFAKSLPPMFTLDQIPKDQWQNVVIYTRSGFLTRNEGTYSLTQLGSRKVRRG